MGRFRIPAEVAQKIQRELRRSRRVQLAITVLAVAGLGVALWLAWRDEITPDRCGELYAAAQDSQDTLRIDSLPVELGDTRALERGGKDPVSCRAFRAP